MEKEQAASRFSRREFLQQAAAIAASSLVPNIPEITTSVPVSPEVSKSHPPSETEITTSEWLNTLSAAAVATTFGASVTAAATGKKPFGLASITAMFNVELARLLTLIVSGKEDEARKEASDIVFSLSMAGFLTAAAEAASQGKGSVVPLLERNGAFSSLNDTLAVAEVHAGNHTLPTLKDQPLATCEIALKLYKTEVMHIAAAQAALATNMAPFMSTYGAASAVNDGIPPMFRSLVNAYIAEAVVKHKKQGLDFDEKVLKQKAIEKAQAKINGQAGYAHLMLAIAANLNGSLIFGDPPMFFLAAQRPEDFIPVSIEGLALSEMTTCLANVSWLAQTGLFDGQEEGSLKSIANLLTEFRTEYGSYQQKAAVVFLNSLENRQLRDVSFGGARTFATKIHHLLSTMNENSHQESARKLKEILEQIPETMLYWDGLSLLQQKMRLLKEAPSSFWEKFVTRPQELLASSDYQNVSAALFQAAQQLHATQQSKNIAELTTLFVDILTGSSDNLSQRLVDMSHNVTSGANGAKFLLTYFSQNPDENSTRELLATLGQLGKDEVRKSLQMGLDTYRGISSHKDDHLFGETAKDVFTALATQLPAIKSLVHIAEKFLDWKLGLKDEPISEQKVNEATLMVLTTTAVLSSFADNVAAYLFGRELLERIYERAYGEKYHQNPALETYLDKATVLCAIAGGSGTKIGNGPNFQIEKLTAKLSDSEDQLFIERAPLTLGKSMLNPYAISQIAAVITELYQQKKFRF